FDPADTDDDVKRAAAALAVIAGPGQALALRQFFGMYRAGAANDDIAAAVVSVAEALTRLGDPEARVQIAEAATDPTTVSYARDRLGALIAAEPVATPLDADKVDGAKANAKK
ncbi:MAG: hypothetical protein ACREJ3_11840, partial [Polyangiaceae bacterium]